MIRWLCLLALVLLPSLSVAAEPRVTDVRVEVSKGVLFVSAQLRHGFSDAILHDLHNGIPKEFYYYLVLKRKQANWIDEEMLSKTLRYLVRYDRLKQQYTLEKSDHDAPPATPEKTTWNDLASMQAAVEKVDPTALAAHDTLKPGQKYYVNVKAQMQAARPPFYLEYLLFFVPFLEIDTPWARSPSFRR
jgi:hypothetical protein